MEIDKDKVKTLEESHETAPMDVANDRVKAEMKKLEKEAKKQVAEGLQENEADKPGSKNTGSKNKRD